MAGAKPTVTRNRPVSQSSDSEPGIASFPRVSESDASDIAELVPEVFSQEVEQVLESGVDSGHLVELDEDAQEDVRRDNKLRADLGSLTTFLNGHAKDVKDKMVELLAAAPVPAVAAVPAPQAGGVSGQADKRRDLVRESGSWSGN